MNKSFYPLRILFLLALFLISDDVLQAASREGNIAVSQITRSESVEWDDTLLLPSKEGTGKPNIGVAGVFSGIIDNRLVVLGGANFPDGLPSEGGHKKWHGDIYVYDKAGGTFEVLPDAMPHPLAYGVSVTLRDGLLCIGGCDSAQCYSDVLLFSLDTSGKPRFERYPSLPHPLADAAGCRMGNKIYISGGIESMNNPVATKDFFVLDLDDLNRGWRELPAWDGPPRAFAVSAAQSDGVDDCVYLFSGRDFHGDSPWNVLYDGYSYNTRLGTWKKLEGRFPVMAGSAAPFGANHILLFGGRSECDTIPNDVLRLYHTVTGTLVEAGIPSGIDVPVTTNVVVSGEDVYLTSGEIRPGVRTPVVLHGRLHSSVRHINWLDISVIVLYFIVLFLIGWHFSKRQKNTSDYFKGGGRVPWFVAGLSIFGTALSAITFMSVPAKAYASDWSYMPFNLGIVLVVPLIAMLFIPYYRKLDVTTAYEYLEIRFNSLVRVICSVSFILFQIGRMAVVLLLPAIALNVATGMDIFMCIALMGFLSLLYTMMGGIEAVVWTDALQVVVLLGAAISVIALACSKIPGGISGFVAAGESAHKFSLGSTAFNLRQPTLWTVLIATIFTNITTYGTDQTIVQRYLTTSTEKKARKGVYANAALTVPATLIFFTLGTALWAFYKFFPRSLGMTVTDGDAILPWFMSTQLPNGVLGLVIAGLFAAAMSTLSASMNSSATAFVTDIYPKIFRCGGDRCSSRRMLKLARMATLVLGLIGIGFAFVMASRNIKSLWDEFNTLLGILLGGLGGLFLLGMTTKRANSFGAVCGIVASVAVQIFVTRTQAVHLLLYSSTGFIACYVVGYLCSILHDLFVRPKR
ncbi:MAG: sodium/solute symporter [Bacteroidales bacterium]|nr:sodium/solute symporter [Bacteroidales bacterium]MCI2121553.1 sodium/solute symporter [Bacteroidales bacterium]MCI2145066.1 sodium/solute symporter [Bacteroidales bacterium]